MFLQRLVIHRDTSVGFNYDHMGSAEFEGGVTRASRVVLAKLLIDSKMEARKTRFFERWGRSTRGPVDVIVFGAKTVLDALMIAPPPGTKVPYDLILTADQEPARIDDDKYVAWMSVRMDDPILIVRAEQVNFERADNFLSLFVDAIEKEEREAREQLLYTYANGWTLNRETGLIVLPQNDGVPIEAGGQWILRDDSGNPVDRDRYFSDITERYQRKIGDPLPTED